MTRFVALLCVAVTVAVTAAACAGGTASAAIPVGIATQDYGHFSTAPFADVGWHRVRYIAPWNVALKRRDRDYFRRYLSEANDLDLEVFVTFNVANGSHCPGFPCRLPSVAAYTRAFKAFRRRFPSVRVIGAWNEANHRSQPTFRNPRRAAQYYNVVRRYCRGCTIVAADVIDEGNLVSWLRQFKLYAQKPRLWGLHNYKDTNPRRGQIFGGTRRMLQTVRGPIWLTETGGIVYFKLPSGAVLFPASESRANRALKRMFRLAKRYRSRIKRLYIYNWEQSPRSNRFDAGLVRNDGTPRPGYRTVRRAIHGGGFKP